MIQLQLSNDAYIMYSIRNNIVSSGIINSFEGKRDFDFRNLEVRIQPVTQGNFFFIPEMVDGRYGVFLYQFTQFLRICEASIPENIDNLELSLIYEMRSNGVVLDRVSRFIDMTTEQFLTYRVRPGTQEEYEKCMA